MKYFFEKREKKKIYFPDLATQQRVKYVGESQKPWQEGKAQEELFTEGVEGVTAKFI